jgi:NhaP-type Na+/H+ or K+/H+ antiporter
VALALVLFTDATRIKLRALMRASLPDRLLAIGMPLTIVAGATVAVLLLSDLTVWEAAILATILAPTDAGLGQVVVNNPRIPARIRQALNIEAGLNDGISLPFLMLFVALAIADPGVGRFAWISYTLQQIGFGILIGLAIGWLGGWLLHHAKKRAWMTETFQLLSLLCLALLAWGLAEQMGGNGFLAAFTGGIFVKVGFERAGEHMIEFIEAWGQLLSFAVFYLFGMLAAPDLGRFNAVSLLYALLSLTLVRMVPVAVSLVGTRLKPASVLFLGWFGPRGLASVVLGLVYLKQKVHLPGEKLIILAIVATVLLSVFAHGISALPASRWYVRQVEGMEPGAPELAKTVDPASVGGAL